VFERALAPGFARTCSVEEVVDVLGSVPCEYLLGLSGVYLMAGTSKQQRLRKLTFGLYYRERIFLFPVPLDRLSQGWPCSSNPSDVKRYTKFGARVSSSRGGRSTVTLDEIGLQRFYLYDVLLHELGHHVDRLRRTGDPERYARWFAEFQQSQLTHPAE